MPLKYVMLKLESGDLLPLMFPEFVEHAEIAQSLSGTVMSAGRVFLEHGKLVARGDSGSLGLSSREHDSEIIHGYLDGKNVILREC